MTLRTMSWGPKGNMVPITYLLHTTSLRLHLCLLYPSHPRAFPNMHSFPSNSSPPPKPSFHPKHSCPTECREVGKAVHELFWCFFGRFPLVLLVVTIYHWIEKILSIKTLENLLRLLLSNLVRIKKHVFVHYL